MPERTETGDYMLVVGGGKVGWNLARELIDKGHEVALIEADRTGSSTGMRPSSGSSSGPASPGRAW